MQAAAEEQKAADPDAFQTLGKNSEESSLFTFAPTFDQEETKQVQAPKRRVAISEAQRTIQRQSEEEKAKYSLAPQNSQIERA